MPPIELTVPFIMATSIFALLPGPGLIYMSVQTMALGRRAGWWCAAGFHLAGYFHILAAAFGVSLLLEIVPVLFVTLKLFGAGYLIVMGIRMILNAGQPGHTLHSQPDRRAAGQAFKDSLTVELINPKTAVFFLAFLPQFASTAAPTPVWAQIIVLGTMANIAFSATDAVCVVLSARLAAWVRASQGIARIGRQAGGTLLIGLGIHLAWQDR